MEAIGAKLVWDYMFTYICYWDWREWERRAMKRYIIYMIRVCIMEYAGNSYIGLTQLLSRSLETTHPKTQACISAKIESFTKVANWPTKKKQR